MNFWKKTSWYHLQNYQRVQKEAETLDVTEARQYRERSLIHISDDTYRFFMAMESEHLKSINNHKLKEQKEDLIKVAKGTMKNKRAQSKVACLFLLDERPACEVIYFQSSSNCDGISEGEASFTFTLKQLYWFFYVQYKLSHFDWARGASYVKRAKRLRHGFLVGLLHALVASTSCRGIWTVQ